MDQFKQKIQATPKGPLYKKIGTRDEITHHPKSVTAPIHPLGECLNHIAQSAYYINLDYRLDRRAHTEKMLSEFGILAERIRAHCYDETDGFSSPTTRGCAMSHHEVIMKAKSIDAKAVLIMEDDMNIIDPEGLRLAILEAISLDWDYIFGYHSSESRIIKSYKHANQITGTLYTHFYLVHNRMFDFLLDAIPLVRETIDVLLLEAPGIKFAPKKTAVTQLEGFSDIDERMKGWFNF